jgi:hypothetical protein
MRGWIYGKQNGGKVDVSCLAAVPISEYKKSNIYFNCIAGYLICSKVPHLPYLTIPVTNASEEKNASRFK